MNAVLFILIFILGTVFGSFYNCLAMRLEREEDFIKGRSHCMSCGHELSALDLIPVLSYVFSGGKCRYCKEKVSVRYPLTEVLFGLLTLGVFIKDLYLPAHAAGTDILSYLFVYPYFNPWILVIRFLRDFILVGMLFTLSVVDIETYIIPDGLIITALIAWIVSAFFLCDGIKDAGLHLLAGLVGGAFMLILSGIMDRVLKKESLGGGDVKLIALLGLYLSFFGLYELLLFSSLIGIAVAVITKSRKIPFGPSIAAGAYLVLLVGDVIRDAYLSLF